MSEFQANENSSPPDSPSHSESPINNEDSESPNSQTYKSYPNSCLMSSNLYAVQNSLPIPAPHLLHHNKMTIKNPTNAAQLNNALNVVPTTTLGAIKEIKKKKRVQFSKDTIFHANDNIALSILKHSYSSELGYTQYYIQFLYKGITWTIIKRYRDFTQFHSQLCKEFPGISSYLPKLPKKRWFEKQRWINRYEDSYSSLRRISLQNYLREVLAFGDIRMTSVTLKNFINFPSENHLDNDELNDIHLPDSEKNKSNLNKDTLPSSSSNQTNQEDITTSSDEDYEDSCDENGEANEIAKELENTTVSSSQSNPSLTLPPQSDNASSPLDSEPNINNKT